MTQTPPSQAVEAAVEALESCSVGGYRDVDGDWCERLFFDKEKVTLALSALRAELARPLEVAAPVEEAFHFKPQFPERETPEPSIADMVYLYYRGRIDDAELADESAFRYLAASRAPVRPLEVAAPVGGAPELKRELWSLIHEWSDTLSDERADWIERRVDELITLLAASRVPVALPAEPVDWTQIYVLIAQMFRQPDEVLRSMMAQDLCRLLKLGSNAKDADTRAAHLEAAGNAIAKDREMFATPPGGAGGEVGADQEVRLHVRHSEWQTLSPEAQESLMNMGRRAVESTREQRRRDGIARANFPAVPLSATPAAEQGDAKDARPDSFHSDSGECDRVQAPLLPEQVEWVVNDIAELGVKIGNQFFWLYKGHSLVYGGESEEVARGVVLNEDTEPPTVMHWRPVFKREFGECCHPINYKDFSKIGTVSRSDSEEWKPVPADILASGKAGPAAGEGK